MNTQRAIICICAVGTGITGCATTEKCTCVGKPETVLAMPDTKIIGFAGDAYYISDSLYKPVATTKYFKTDNLLHASGANGTQDFKVVLGRADDDTDSARGRFLEVTGQTDTYLAFHLACGWAYAYGAGGDPRVQTQRATGSAEGSTMLVRIVPNDGYHRFYFISGTAMRVTRSAESYYDFAAPGYYIEVDANDFVRDSAGNVVVTPIGNDPFKAVVDERKAVLTTMGPP